MSPRSMSWPGVAVSLASLPPRPVRAACCGDPYTCLCELNRTSLRDLYAAVRGLPK